MSATATGPDPTTAPRPSFVHQPAAAGAAFWGPGAMYRFLVTGVQTRGAYFAMEAVVPPGGGPPARIHHNEDETFYIVEGEAKILIDDAWVTAREGDLVHVPKGAVHCFHNYSRDQLRMILTFTPAGIESFFEQTLERALDPTQRPPDNFHEVAARYAEAGPRYGIEFAYT
jgi:mannose-6-phosphate isomerase-like protein (cupin superfamily)